MPPKQRQIRMQQQGGLAAMQQLETRTDEELERENGALDPSNPHNTLADRTLSDLTHELSEAYRNVASGRWFDLPEADAPIVDARRLRLWQRGNSGGVVQVGLAEFDAVANDDNQSEWRW